MTKTASKSANRKSDASAPEPLSADALRTAVAQRLYNTLGTALHSASKHDIYMALSLAVRDLLIDRWRRTTDAQYEANPKFVYYLSAEYMLGKQLSQNLLYTGITEAAAQVLASFGMTLEEFLELEPEPGLGNGGLGRLAACFIDSLATLDLPAVGYGIRYEFGIFRQTFVDGWQVEQPDTWLLRGNPWEFIQPDDMIEVGFGGYTDHVTEGGKMRVRWQPARRCWASRARRWCPATAPTRSTFCACGARAARKSSTFRCSTPAITPRPCEQKIYSENISKVLYPNDGTPQGRELRLRQQYFFVACSLHDIIRRFRLRNSDWNTFPDKVSIQLNDTHPVIAIPELMRILLDEEGLNWDQAWRITQRTFAYTCHTLLPEALEKWPVSLFEYLLPRHLEIIYEINHRFLAHVRARFPGDDARVARMSLIEEGGGRQVRMANLASVGSFAINGVAALHSQLLRDHTLADFATMFPDRFQNKTNGVSPRRFMKLANPRLCDLITERSATAGSTTWIGCAGWSRFADDAAFRRGWREIKQHNKANLAAFVQHSTGEARRSRRDDGCDGQAPARIQAPVAQAAAHRHPLPAAAGRPESRHRAAHLPLRRQGRAGYATAKLIIKLVNSVAEVVNADPIVRDRLKVVFPPNFNVTMGQIIYPGAELSEQISLAGKEASGTGNMKFALNGALTIGTLDGANIEIRELVGAENFFLFGLDTQEVMELKARGYHPYDWYANNRPLKRAVDAIAPASSHAGTPRSSAR
jgi:starch phosphorylase